MISNPLGEIVLYTWNDLVNHNIGIKLGEFVIMPNHFHGIIHILDPDTEWDDFIPSNFIIHHVGAGSEPAPTDHQKQNPLSEIIRQFKTFSARRINQIRNNPGNPVWQRNYYEHIIRNQESYDQIVEYIQNNPDNWKMDKLFIS
jgi:REP element-mobilizing transposase RayT